MANIVVRALRALGIGRARIEPDEVLALPEYALGLKGIDNGDSSVGGLIAKVIEQGQAPKRGDVELIESYKRLPWLRAVLDRVATSVSSSTPEVYRTRGNDRRKLDVHPLLDLMGQPNPVMTGRAMWKLVETYIDLKGESFNIIERNGAGRPVELWPIPPHWVKDIPTGRSPFFEVEHGSWRQIVDAEDMLWFRNSDPINPYGRGTGLAEALADELDTDEYAAKHIKTWFFNKAIPAMMIALKGASKDQAILAQQKFENMNRGLGRAHRTHFHGGEMDVKELNPSFKDMQLVELRQFERDAIVQVFGVPPEILGIIENSNRATIDAADALFSRWVITPRLQFIASEINMRLTPQFGNDIELAFESVIPADKDHQLATMKAAPWAFTANEWRKHADGDAGDLEPGDDRYAIPSNIQDLVLSLSEELTPRTSARPSTERAAFVETKAVSPQEIEFIADALDPIILEALYEPEVGALILDFGEDALRGAGVSGSFNMLSPIVIEHIQSRAGDMIAGINTTTKNAIKDALQSGVLAGEGPRQLANRISDVMRDATRRRAITIARTEVATSANFGRWQGMAQSGLVFRRRWLTARDARVRDPHRFLHGKTTGMNEPFTLSDGGRTFTAMHPGGFGVAKLDINCRCVTVPVIDPPEAPTEARAFTDPDASADELEAEAVRLDEKFARWEERVRRTFARGFRRQTEDVLDRLEQITARTP